MGRPLLCYLTNDVIVILRNSTGPWSPWSAMPPGSPSSASCAIAVRAIDDTLLNHLLAVEHHRDLAADQTDVVSFPFTSRLAGVFAWRDAAIKGAGTVSIRWAAIVIQDLHFIAIPQSYPAVAVLAYAEFDVQHEIPELLLAH